jgi:hypothetical protein
MKKVKLVLDVNDIKYFYTKNRFHNLFFVTKKYKELVWSKEAFLTLILSSLLTWLLSYLISVNNPINGIISVIPILQALFPIVLGGLFSLLGFVIGGLALITGTISEKVILKINEKNNIQHLISVIFNFYFCGAITGFTIILAVFAYIITFVQLPFNWFLFLPGCFIISYFTIFSIIYSVMLLGTCIRILLLRYHTLTSTEEK